MSDTGDDDDTGSDASPLRIPTWPGGGGDAGAADAGTRKRGTSKQVQPWFEEETQRLVALVQSLGGEGNLCASDWSEIARRLGGRTPKQVREKFKNDLRPGIQNKEAWTMKEEYVLALAHSRHRNRWADVAQYLPKRSENTIKNRW
ncbi:Myb-related protein 3R-1 [Tetrabaena socialis]|uniref:Myb-related protein 3R-1 n=1 Tax=Tetrabaena socialis TaxID=47790 RepID=A0A2J7ZVD4_9CHLO|nr:Myb-related protein 3R-1 [Tetrabaena socialis]|eukprot:PNH04233.1 Myb-related protein 3R-1 [Tetrabaena socialis]